jgi:hypothetical protein
MEHTRTHLRDYNIRALGPRDRQANQEVKEASKVTFEPKIRSSDAPCKALSFLIYHNFMPPNSKVHFFREIDI